MDLATVPDELDCMLFAKEFIEGEVGNSETVTHGELCKGYVVFFLLSEFWLIKVGVDELIEPIVDVLYLGLLLGVEPAQQRVYRPHIFHDQRVLAIELYLGMQLCEDVFAHLYYILRLDKGTIFQAADYEQENIST